MTMYQIYQCEIVTLILATISVLPRLHVTTIQSFGTASRDVSNEGANREASFVLLQLLNALKSLQARGIEDTSKSLNDVLLCREDKDVCYRLYLLQGLGAYPHDDNIMQYNNLITYPHPVMQHAISAFTGG